MKAYVKYSLLAVGLCAAATACIEDIGNYTYRTIDAVEIEGIASSDHPYVIPLGDTLRITPKLTFTEGAKDSFAYAWHVLSSTAPNASRGVISRERNLVVPVGGLLGTPTTHNMMYCITNTNTGVRYDWYFQVKVQSSKMDKGYIMLYEKADSFEIALMADYSGEYIPYGNVLALSGCTLPKAGERPIDLQCFPDNSAPKLGAGGKKYAVWLLTDKRTTRIRCEDFAWEPAYSIAPLIYSPERFVPDRNAFVADKMFVGRANATNPSSRTYVLSGGNFYFFNWTPVVTFYDLPINITSYTDTAPYRVAPYLLENSGIAVMFNESSRRFMVHDGSDTRINGNTKEIYKSAPLSAGEDYFPWADTGYHLLYMGYRTGIIGTTANGYAVMRNNTANRYELLLFQIPSRTNTNVVQQGRNMFSPLPDNTRIEDIRFWAYHASLPYLFAATDQKVFRINTTSMTVTDVTAQAIAPPYTKISLMKSGAVRMPAEAGLLLATYDEGQPADQCGRFDVFGVEDGTGNLFPRTHLQPDSTLVKVAMSGMGKIVAVDYKSPID